MIYVNNVKTTWSRYYCYQLMHVITYTCAQICVVLIRYDYLMDQLIARETLIFDDVKLVEWQSGLVKNVIDMYFNT